MREKVREERIPVTLSDPGQVLSLRLTRVSTSKIFVASAIDLGIDYIARGTGLETGSHEQYSCMRKAKYSPCPSSDPRLTLLLRN